MTSKKVDRLQLQEMNLKSIKISMFPIHKGSVKGHIVDMIIESKIHCHTKHLKPVFFFHML